MLELVITTAVIGIFILGLCRKDIACIKKQVDEMVRLQELGVVKQKE